MPDIQNFCNHCGNAIAYHGGWKVSSLIESAYEENKPMNILFKVWGDKNVRSGYVGKNSTGCIVHEHDASLSDALRLDQIDMWMPAPE